MIDELIKERVKRLFAEEKRSAQTCRINPVTMGHWVPGLDSEAAQQKKAAEALRAQVIFKQETGGVLPDLPLSHEAREHLKQTGKPCDYLVSLYARSLAYNDMAIDKHPTFQDFAAGVLASGLAPPRIAQDPDLCQQYPPTPLPGLGGGCIWRP